MAKSKLQLFLSGRCTSDYTHNLTIQTLLFFIYNETLFVNNEAARKLQCMQKEKKMKGQISVTDSLKAHSNGLLRADSAFKYIYKPVLHRPCLWSWWRLVTLLNNLWNFAGINNQLNVPLTEFPQTPLIGHFHKALFLSQSTTSHPWSANVNALAATGALHAMVWRCFLYPQQYTAPILKSTKLSFLTSHWRYAHSSKAPPFLPDVIQHSLGNLFSQGQTHPAHS